MGIAALNPSYGAQKLKKGGGSCDQPPWVLRQVVEKRSRGSRDKADTGEKAEFTGVNEHFEPISNAPFFY
jgi:hypothetical protein